MIQTPSWVSDYILKYNKQNSLCHKDGIHSTQVDSLNISQSRTSFIFSSCCVSSHVKGQWPRNASDRHSELNFYYSLKIKSPLDSIRLRQVSPSKPWVPTDTTGLGHHGEGCGWPTRCYSSKSRFRTEDREEAEHMKEEKGALEGKPHCS